jgi:hypothetical protein
MPDVTFKNLGQVIVECLARLRFARMLGAEESVSIFERHLNYLLAQVPPHIPTAETVGEPE